MSLPEDHMITIERLRTLLNDEIADNCVSKQSSNEDIFIMLLNATQSDNQLLGLSIFIERLVTGGLLVSDCPNIESFRNG